MYIFGGSPWGYGSMVPQWGHTTGRMDPLTFPADDRHLQETSSPLKGLAAP